MLIQFLCSSLGLSLLCSRLDLFFFLEIPNNLSYYSHNITLFFSLYPHASCIEKQQWHMNDITHTAQKDLTLGRLQLPFLLCDSSNDFGQRKWFRRLLLVAKLLELCSLDSSSAPQVQQMTTAPRWIQQFPLCLHVCTWTTPDLFRLFLYYARWQESLLFLKSCPHNKHRPTAHSVLRSQVSKVNWSQTVHLLL